MENTKGFRREGQRLTKHKPHNARKQINKTTNQPTNDIESGGEDIFREREDGLEKGEEGVEDAFEDVDDASEEVLNRRR